MNRGLIIFIAAVLLGAGTYFGTRQFLKRCDCMTADEVPVENGSLLPELQWLRRSFHLTEAQFGKVQALHLAYQPRCADLCMKIQHSDHELMMAAASSRTVTEDVSKLLQTRARLTQECQQAMLQHVYETAACMTPEQAERYLTIVLPHVLGPAHASH
ncbi:hypothetical protein [Prosthecobacter sp.]|uniref:hypothetical protein n=1 Tax=Prosthecobacter sp. TaxID=1965333 RepID=UPI0037837C6A